MQSLADLELAVQSMLVPNSLRSTCSCPLSTRTEVPRPSDSLFWAQYKVYIHGNFTYFSNVCKYGFQDCVVVTQGEHCDFCYFVICSTLVTGPAH